VVAVVVAVVVVVLVMVHTQYPLGVAGYRYIGEAMDGRIVRVCGCR
jgi:hypothetical protein